jgi:hypothetical protein
MRVSQGGVMKRKLQFLDQDIATDTKSGIELAISQMKILVENRATSWLGMEE